MCKLISFYYSLCCVRCVCVHVYVSVCVNESIYCVCVSLRMCVCACVCVCVCKPISFYYHSAKLWTFSLPYLACVRTYMQANVNLGMVMVYTLTSAVQARLGEFAEAFGQEQEQEKRRREEEERVKEEVRTCDVATTEK